MEKQVEPDEIAYEEAKATWLEAMTALSRAQDRLDVLLQDRAPVPIGEYRRLSVELRLARINQARAFGRYLGILG